MGLVKSTGKKPLGRPRHRWEDNIELLVKDTGDNTRNWIECGIEPAGCMGMFNY